jgi:exonuclease SbcD
LRILHSSDWHLGRTLGEKRRYDEFAAFLDWIIDTIHAEAIDAVLIAGDIFDTTAPSHRALQLYYDFLQKVGKSRCRHVVLIGGNHDSASLLAAPQRLLRALDVHVVAAATDPIDDEIVVLKAADGSPEMIICAVPYLRDRDIRKVDAGESYTDKQAKLIQGIQDHYAAVVQLAEEKRSKLGDQIPLVAMGHLFTAGGQTMEGDGVRELYVGSLAHVSAAMFPPTLDYVALGHLHIPQKIGGNELRRYSGSPIPMSFGEYKQEKCVVVVDFIGRAGTIKLFPIPKFQRLERIRGDLAAIKSQLAELVASEKSIWTEVTYDSLDVVGDLRNQVEAAVRGSQVEVLSIKNLRVGAVTLNESDLIESLEDLKIEEVFERCLSANDVPEEQRQELRDTFGEARDSLTLTDINVID